MRLSRDRTDFWLYASLFGSYLGTVSVFGQFERYTPVANPALLAWLALTWAASAWALLRLRRLPLGGVTLLILALLPYLYFAYFYFSGASLVGSFSYFYKFAPLLLFPLVYLWVLGRDDDRVRRTLLLLATVMAVRVLLAFALPSAYPGNAGSGAPSAWDDVLIYERVSGLPRVFFPGMALVFWGLLISVEQALTRPTGLRLELLRVGLFLGALGVTFTRGVLLSAFALVLVYVAIRWLSTQVSLGRRLRLVMGATLALLGISFLLAITPAGVALSQVVQRFQGQERFSLNLTNIDWRQQQSELAFSLVQTPAQRWLGVGTNVTIPEDIRAPDPTETTGELHYSYHSIQWTFGYLGLGLLVFGGLVWPALLLVRFQLRSPFALTLGLTLAFIAVIGSYTIVFTNADWNFMMVFVGAYLAARAKQAAEAARTAALFPAALGREPFQERHGPSFTLTR